MAACRGILDWSGVVGVGGVGGSSLVGQQEVRLCRGDGGTVGMQVSQWWSTVVQRHLQPLNGDAQVGWTGPCGLVHVGSRPTCGSSLAHFEMLSGLGNLGHP